MDFTRMKKLLRKQEQAQGVRNLDKRRYMNALISDALVAGGKKRRPTLSLDASTDLMTVEQALTKFVQEKLKEYKESPGKTQPFPYPYFLETDGKVVKLDTSTKIGGDAQGSLYSFRTRPDVLIKIGPTGDLVAKDYGYNDSMNRYVENFYALKMNNWNQTDVVRVQNLVASHGLAPYVLAAGLMRQHRITIMETIQNAETLEERVVDSTMWPKVYEPLAKFLKRINLCHHDLHARNVVYGWLPRLKGQGKKYFLVDFDNSFFRTKATKECNDKIYIDFDKENTISEINFAGEVEMPRY
jgi:hypothetical protein